MPDQPLVTRPLNSFESKIKEKYAESFAAQSDLMDKLAQQLLTLELAIPGLYATALKLVAGDKATLQVGFLLYLTFGFWFLALLLTLLALLPGAWRVNPTILERDPASTSGELGLKDFFVETARYKRNRLMVAIVLFFFGIAFAALNLS